MTTKLKAVQPTAQNIRMLELGKREELKAAVNIHALSTYYAPQGRFPDILDFQMMYTRVTELPEDVDPKTVIRSLFPSAQESFTTKLLSVLDYARTQFQAAADLYETMPTDVERPTMLELFTHGEGNSRTGIVNRLAAV